MIDCSRLTKPERDVLEAALRDYDERLSRLATKSHNTNVIADCKWRTFVAAQLHEQVAGQ